MVMFMVKKRIGEMAEQNGEKDDQKDSTAQCD